MIRVLSDALMAADRQQVTLLGLLDLSAAFDCVDHTLLLQQLAFQYGLADGVLQLIRSFVSGLTQQVLYDGQLSSVQPLQFGVPQESVLGPRSLLCTRPSFTMVLSYINMPSTAKCTFPRL